VFSPEVCEENLERANLSPFWLLLFMQLGLKVSGTSVLGTEGWG